MTPRVEPLEILWPGLRGTSFEETSPQDPDYNCLAWALEEQDRVWSPYRDAGDFWPVEYPDSDELPFVVAALEHEGFEVTAAEEIEAGWQKLALFATDGQFDHVARQLPSGSWTSKLGEWEDIRHDDLRAVETRPTSPYKTLSGFVALFMRRRIKR